MNKYMEANIVFSKLSRDYMEIKRAFPIRPSEMGVLNIVSHREGSFTPLMLAEMMGVSKPMITAHVQALVKGGYAFKETSGEDKRSFFVRPTEKGRTLANEFEARQTKLLEAVEEGLGAERFDELVDLMRNMQTILDKNKGEMICKTTR